MPDRDTDADWRSLAISDPYWAVLTADKFRSENLTDEHRRDFFASGEAFIEWILETARRHLTPDLALGRALDFGCGVGRLLIPLARRCREVIGVDVAEAMLAEARHNLDAAGVTNVRLTGGDETLSGVNGPFDLITSYIVFQHIPPGRGQHLFRRLVELLRDGGLGVVHVTYSNVFHGEDAPFVAWPAAGGFEPPSPPGVRNSLSTLARAGRTWLQKQFRRPAAPAPAPTPAPTPAPAGPVMQMYPYTLNPLVHALQAAGVRRLFVELTDHGGYYGLVMFFRKMPAEGYLA